MFEPYASLATFRHADSGTQAPVLAPLEAELGGSVRL